MEVNRRALLIAAAAAGSAAVARPVLAAGPPPGVTSAGPDESVASVFPAYKAAVADALSEAPRRSPDGAPAPQADGRGRSCACSQTCWMMAKRKAVVSPKRSTPFSASIAPRSAQRSSRNRLAWP